MGNGSYGSAANAIGAIGQNGFSGEALLKEISKALGLENLNMDVILNELAKALGLRSFTINEIVNKLTAYLWAQFRAWIISLIVIATIFVIVSIAYYVFSSISFYKLAKKHGVKYPGLAWIPFLRVYIIGESAEAYSSMKFLGRWNIDYAWLVLLLFPLAQKMTVGAINVLGEIEYIGVVFSAIASIANILLTVVYAVFYLCVLFRLYSIYLEKKHAALYTIASVFVLPIPFLVFSLLKKEKITDGEDFVVNFRSDNKDEKKAESPAEEKALPQSETTEKETTDKETK